MRMLLHLLSVSTHLGMGTLSEGVAHTDVGIVQPITFEDDAFYMPHNTTNAMCGTSLPLPSPNPYTPTHLPPPHLLPQLPQRNLLIIMFIQHLRSRQIEVLLRNMHSPLPQRIHTRLRTYAFQLCSGAAVHLLCDFS